MAQVIEINEIEKVESFRLTWAALLNETPGASFFQSLDWLQAYWQHFGSQQRLRLLIVFNSGRPVGIVPLTLRREQTRIGPVDVLTYPLHDWGTFYGPIGRDRTATLLAALRHIQDGHRDWDLLDLRWNNKDEQDRGRTPTAMQAVGLTPSEQLWKQTHIIDFAKSWGEYLRSRNPRFRSNLGRIERRAEQAGELSFERYRPDGISFDDADPQWGLLGECMDLASRSWQGSAKNGTTLSHESIHGFLRTAHSRAARAGTLDVNVLRFDGQPIAFSYNYRWHGDLYGLRMGFDPAYASLSPGVLLMMRSIQDSIGRGDRQLDLGTGQPDFKRRWSTRTASSFRHTCYSPASLRAQLLRVKHWLATKPHAKRA